MEGTKVLEGNSLEAFFKGEEPTETPQQTAPQNIEEMFKEEELQEPAQVTEPQQETVISQQPQTNFYSDLVKELLEDGDWEDVAIQMEEGQDPINISDMTDITPEMFKELKAAQKELQKEDITNKYISVEGLSETDRKIVELMKKGGNVTPLLQIQAQHVHPLKDLDLDDERVQEYLVASKLRAKGLNEEIVQAEVRRLKTNLILDLEAKKNADEINIKFDEMVAADLNKRNAEIAKAEEDQKLFRKTMNETIKTYGLKDTLTKTLLDNSSKPDENGLTAADKLFFQAKENPELFAKVNFLLTDEKAFDEFYGTKVKNEVNIKTAQKIIRIHPKNNNTASTAPKAKSELEELFKQ